MPDLAHVCRIRQARCKHLQAAVHAQTLSQILCWFQRILMHVTREQASPLGDARTFTRSYPSSHAAALPRAGKQSVDLACWCLASVLDHASKASLAKAQNAILPVPLHGCIWAPAFAELVFGGCGVNDRWRSENGRQAFVLWQREPPE